MVVGPIAVAYNLAGVDEPDVHARPCSPQIFAGKITKWNDPAITALNSGADPAGRDHRARSTARTRRARRTTSPSTSPRPRPTDWTFEPRQGLEGSRRPGREGLGRRRRGAEVARRTRSATSSTPSPRSGSLGVGQDRQRRRRGRADARRTRPRRSRPAKVTGTGDDLTPQARLRDQDAGRLPDRPGDVRDHLREGPAGDRARPDQVLPDLHRRATRARASSTATSGYAPLPGDLLTKVQAVGRRRSARVRRDR